MDVLLADDEREIRDLARTFLADRTSATMAREFEHDEVGYSPELWKQIADLGWLGIPLREDVGGSGAVLQYAGLILEEIGRHIAPIPLHSTWTAAVVLDKHASPELRQSVLPRVCDGTVMIGLAVQEGAEFLTAQEPGLTASRQGDEFVLDGVKTYVDNMAAASALLVTCATADQPGGTSAFLVEVPVSGISHTPLVTLAKDQQSKVTFDGVRVPASALIGPWGQAREVIEDIVQYSAAFMSAQIVGAARRDAEFGFEYAKQRVAFGRHIGAFQAIQHLSADMVIALDGAELLTREAIWRLGQGLPAAVEVSQAKAFVSQKCPEVCRSSQQIHGGMGFMLEVDLHLWFRRVASWSMRFGTAIEHRRRVASSLLDTPGEVRLGDTQVLAQ